MPHHASLALEPWLAHATAQPETPTKPDALDEPDAAHQSQGLVEYSLRRVRQLRRVVLEFSPGGGPLSAPDPSIYLPGNFEGIL